jgi:hypothetical protein
MTEDELKFLLKIYADLKNHTTVASMKNELADKRVSNVRINHVIYKKMTEDEVVVSRENPGVSLEGSKKNSSSPLYGEVVNMMAESILMEELEKSVSLENILADPGRVSRELIETDLSASQNSGTGAGNPGWVLADQLMKIRKQVDRVSQQTDKVAFSELAEAVFDMKKQLIDGIESQKSMGVIYENEKQVIGEANELVDQVLIRLVKEEYRQGEISVQRLGQILRRLIPDSSELRRLLPKLGRAMLEEGMSNTDFVKLIGALSKELQNDDLVQHLQAGAHEIGISPEELMSEFKIDPSGVAELIHLAAEVRKGAGDEKVLSDLLVEYIERLGSKIALDDVNPNGQKSEDRLKSVMNNVESEIVRKLSRRNVNADVLAEVQRKLEERMEKCFEKLKSEWEHRQKTSAAEDLRAKTIFRMLEDSVEEGDAFQEVLKQVRSSIESGDIDEDNIQQINAEISKLRQARRKKPQEKPLPASILNPKNTRLFIEKEISRSFRYDTPFSVITLSIEKVIPQKPVPPGLVKGYEINSILFGEMAGVIRQPDIVGILNSKMMVVLLPMTEERNAKIALNRILRKLHEKAYIIKEIPFTVQFAGVAIFFDYERTADLDSFIKTVENEHREFQIRLRNVQDLF